MFRSLRVRLFLAMSVVVIGFVATTAFFASRLTIDEFQHYLEYNDTPHQQRVNEVLIGLLQAYYAKHQTWDGSQILLDQLGEVTSTRIILVALNGRIVSDTHHEMVGKNLPLSRISQDAYLKVNDTMVGAVVVYGSQWITPAPAPNTTPFVSTVNQYLLATVLGVGLLALALILVIATRISRPLEALTTAVRSLGNGNLHQQVAIQSKDEIGELASAFNAMSDRLAHVEQLRRNLVSDVAHELRTPITCILGYLEAMQDGVAEPTPELIASLHEEAALLRRLAIDLQELALVDSGQLKLERQPVRFSDLVEQAVSIFQPQANNSGITLHVNLPLKLPTIYADAERIGQVLRNLLKNALAYTPEHGVITVSADARESYLYVTVADTGIGIASEHLPYLFDRFYRADRSRAQATGGAGLGLAIVKNLVEAHGGRVWAESQAGNGAVFVFTLPL